MTLDEAKQIFLDRGFVNGIFDGNKWRESVIVISKWLKQESCDDCISRKAVLELVADYDLSMGQVVKAIHALPPVTPQPSIGQKDGDLISRKVVIDIVEFECGEWKGLAKTIVKAIEQLSSVTPQQKMGKWIFHKPFDNGRKNCNECIECNQCHTWFGYDCYVKTPYCPNCGAKMKGVE